MEKYSRRKWLKTALLGSTAFLSPGLAINGEKYESLKPIEDSKFVYLDANENPYGPSQSAIKVINESAFDGNRYPFEEAAALSEKIAEKHEVEKSSVMLGAGSSGLLQYLGYWIMKEGLHMTYASPTFDILPVFVQRFNIKASKIPLDENKVHDLDRMASASKQNPGVVYVINPNNPTGTKVARDQLLNFCKTVTKHSYVIVDEAYIEYVAEEESIKEIINDNPKVIVLRTFSKIYGLAGLRIGYALAHPEIINKLKEFQIWGNFSLNLLGIKAASASLDDSSFLRQSRLKNRKAVQFTRDVLEELGIKSINTATNFMYFNSTDYKGDYRIDMRKNNILLRESVLGKEKWVRVSIGMMDEMERFAEVTRKLYKN